MLVDQTIERLQLCAARPSSSLLLLPFPCTAGAVKQQPALESSLRSLLALRTAGWKQPPAAAAPSASAAAAVSAADAAADALASQLTLKEPAATEAAVPAPAQTPPQPAPVPAPQAAPAPMPTSAPAPAAPSSAAPAPAASTAPALMPDEWDYLAPGGGVYGPFSMEQLQYWVAQGHLEAGVQVGGWEKERGWEGGRCLVCCRAAVDAKHASVQPAWRVAVPCQVVVTSSCPRRHCPTGQAAQRGQRLVEPADCRPLPGNRPAPAGCCRGTPGAASRPSCTSTHPPGHGCHAPAPVRHPHQHTLCGCIHACPPPRPTTRQPEWRQWILGWPHHARAAAGFPPAG